jgi:DNA adenine methylase
MLGKSCKTPIRYMGGKSRATKTLFSFFPNTTITEYREPFLGGGSMAIEFTRKYPNTPVWVNDKYYNLYCFWKILQESPERLMEQLLSVKSTANNPSTARKLFLDSKERLVLPMTSEFDIAWRWWVCNKCSFSGLGESSGFSEQASVSNFSEKNIRALVSYGKHIKNWKITNLDYSDLLTNDPSVLVYLDPPYARVGKDGKSFLYGKNGDLHKSFDHDSFAKNILSHSSPMLISYDNNELIRSMYKNFSHKTFSLTYTLHSSKNYREDEKNRKELVLYNYDL